MANWHFKKHNTTLSVDVFERNFRRRQFFINPVFQQVADVLAFRGEPGAVGYELPRQRLSALPQEVDLSVPRQRLSALPNVAVEIFF